MKKGTTKDELNNYIDNQDYKHKRAIKYLKQMLEYSNEQRDDLNQRLKHEKIFSTDATNLLCKAREIITRFEDKDNELYICDCNSKNKYAINAFFESVVKFKKLYGKIVYNSTFEEDMESYEKEGLLKIVTVP
tara:strand:- start:1715 stop:2113 length:399 start_codon:yes stop_codon:yes gene_type:complete